jgi:proteasome lid subunit RPN8/RPN11
MRAHVQLPFHLWRELEARCAARYPHEACGFLLGHVQAESVELVQLREVPNRARDPRTSFALEPLELLLAERAAEAHGLACVGLWHSHPERPARPSARDHAGLAGTGLQLIVEVRAGRAHELRAWDLARGNARALTLACGAEPAAGSADRGACRAGRPSGSGSACGT